MDSKVKSKASYFIVDYGMAASSRDLTVSESMKTDCAEWTEGSKVSHYLALDKLV